jgi:hypothetical protein
MYVTLDSQQKMAYIGLREHAQSIVARSLPLGDFAAEAHIDTLHD